MARSRLPSPASSAPVDPVDWRLEPPLHTRVLRALSTPALAGAAVFVVAVIVAIALVWLRPSGGAGDEGFEAQGGGATAEGSSAGAGYGAAPADGADRVPLEHLAPSAPEAGEGSRPVAVHVIGEVVSPGVVEVEAGARVAAAVAAAGGATDAAVLDGVNLARPVVDGEQILVPNAEQFAEASLRPAPLEGETGSDPFPGAPIDLNTADAALLQTLPRVGPALAQRIVEHRQAAGGFTSVEQLLDVSGIGAKTLDGFRDRVVVR